jgi:tetratricopeptide (TPR) repeat protein
MDGEEWDNNLSGSGTSSAGSMGIRFILDPGGRSRFSIGFDFRYSYTKIHTINDPLDRTPITRFDLSNYGIYFTLSSFYGGNKTSGDKAKTYYYRKDYSESLNIFKEFMSEYPTHSNRHRAKEYIIDCEYKIPYQILEQGIQLEKKGKTQNALDKYQLALTKVKNDTVIVSILDKRINQIALLWLIEAEKKLKNGEYIEAYNLVKYVSEFSIEGQKEIRRFKSWVLLGEGKKYQQFGFIGKAMGKYAEGLELNKDLIFEVNSLQYRAGIQMAKLAKEADEYDEIQLAIYSLEFAKELTGDIGNKNEELLTKLKQKIKLLDDYKTRLIINKKMDVARQILGKARTEKLLVGQTIPQVQELLGNPHEKVIGENGKNFEKQLWIYFMNDKSLHLTFSKFRLYKIEQI